MGSMPMWKYDFFDRVEPIEMRDSLSEVLGAVGEGGTLEYGYGDAVKTAGHSCPTVAGAFRVTAAALDELYGDEVPERGGVRVTLKGGPEDGGYGPMSQVISLITGACGLEGFDGLGGYSVRKGLLVFDQEDLQRNTFVFERIGTGDEVVVRYDPGSVEPDPEVRELLKPVLRGDASSEERERFHDLWQDRVRRILEAETDEVVDIHKPN